MKHAVSTRKARMEHHAVCVSPKYVPSLYVGVLFSIKLCQYVKCICYTEQGLCVQYGLGGGG